MTIDPPDIQNAASVMPDGALTARLDAMRAAAKRDDRRLRRHRDRIIDILLRMRRATLRELAAEDLGDMPAAGRWFKAARRLLPSLDRNIERMAAIEAGSIEGIKDKADAIFEFWAPDGPVGAGTSETITALTWSMIEDIRGPAATTPGDED